MGRIMYKDWSSRPDIIIFNKEAVKIREHAINELPESYKAVFHLTDVGGLLNEEVADIMEISIPAAKSRLHRASLFYVTDYQIISMNGENKLCLCVKTS